MTPGEICEVKGVPFRMPVEVTREGTLKTRIEGKLVTVPMAWRPAVFAGRDKVGLLIFRWTDSRTFTRIHPFNLRTLVRKPQGSTASQEAYIRDYGELC